MNGLLQLQIKKIFRETDDAISLELENITGPLPAYEAGQFLTFLFNINGKELRRSYSLSSAPGIDPFLSVTIKRMENGEVSRYLFDHLREEDTLTSLYPTGRFTLNMDPPSQKDLFLIGGGSGITPLLSLLKAALRNMPRSRVILFYSNHRESSTIFYHRLNQLQARHPSHFFPVYFFSDPAYKKIRESPPVTIPGRITNALLEEMVDRFLQSEKEDAEFFLCGPASLMRMAQLTLTFMGFSGDQIRRENFVSPLITAPLQTHSGSTVTATATIRYRGKKYLLNIPAGENILQAALDQGIMLPYSCRGGLCSACSAFCSKGKVSMLVNEVLTDRDIAEGRVLTCVGIPLTEELEINFD